MESGILTAILQNETRPPHSYKEYHEFLSVRGCEENLEFLSDTLSFQQLAYQFFPDPIEVEKTADFLRLESKIPFPKKPDGWSAEKYEQGLDMIKKQFTDLMEKYVMLGSPRQIHLPNEIVKALQGIIDLGYFHPDTMDESYSIIFQKLLGQDFNNFLYPQGQSIATNYSKIITSPSLLDKIEENPMIPISNEHSNTMDSVFDSDSICPVSTLASRTHSTVIKSNRNTVKKISNIHSLSQTIIPVTEITIDKVVENLTMHPYSRDDYRTFLEITKSEENLDFLVDILNYRSIASSFYPITVSMPRTSDLLENCSQLCKFTRPPSMTDLHYESEFNIIKAAAEDIANRYLKSMSVNEVNISSKTNKPLLLLIETGYYNPEIFAEAYSHIRDMLQQNGFDNFLKAASATTFKTENNNQRSDNSRKQSETAETSRKLFSASRFLSKSGINASAGSLSINHREATNSDAHNSHDSKTGTLSERKIVPSSRTAVKQTKPKIQKKESPQGSVINEESKEKGRSVNSLNSLASRDSKVSQHALEQSKMIDLAGMMEVLSHTPTKELEGQNPNKEISSNLPANAKSEDEPNVSQTGKKAIPRSGRAAIKASGRSASRIAAQKVPASKVVSTDDAEESGKDKKGLFGFGRKK